MENLKKQSYTEKSEEKPNKGLWLAIFATIVMIVATGVLLAINKGKNMIFPTSPAAQIIASPTPMPFFEMTIPYLRQRQYKSELGGRTLLSNGSSYRSYLTSYTSDGLKINALLTIPNTERPIAGHPAIVFVHGYIPPTLYETNGTAYSSYIDYFARSGYVVLKIDLRGHGNSEGEPGGGYYGSDYVVDTLNAYAALSSFDEVNPSKIGMWGHSMAGNILLRSAAIKQNIPAVDIWGGAVFTYSDRLKYGINDNSYRPPMTQNNTRRRRDDLVKTYGDFTENSSFWSQVAPTNYLKDIKGAIQLDHAVDDATVNIGYSRDLAVLLEKSGVNYTLNEYPSGGHDIEGVNFSVAMQNAVALFDKYLKGNDQ